MAGGSAAGRRRRRGRGATGVSQIIEIVRQLRGEADGRQVEGAKAGLTVNFGGFGNNVVAVICAKE